MPEVNEAVDPHSWDAVWISALRQHLLDTTEITDVRIGPLTKELNAGVALVYREIEADEETGSVMVETRVQIRDSGNLGALAMLRKQRVVYDAFRVLKKGVTISGIPVTVTWRERSANLGLDDQGRYDVIDTYVHRTDRLVRV